MTNHNQMQKNKKAAIAVCFILLISIPYVSCCGSCGDGGGGVPIPQFPTPSSSSTGKCPRNALRFGVCAGLLKDLIKEVKVGDKLSKKCCTVLDGLLDLEVAVCLCTAIKGNILGINLNIPISLSLLLNVCNKTVPPKYQCA